MTNKCDFHVSGDIDDTLPIIYGVFQDQGVELDDSHGSNILNTLSEQRGFRGKAGEFLILHISENGQNRTFVLMGLGEAKKLTGELLRGYSGDLSRLLRRNKIQSAQFLLESCQPMAEPATVLIGNLVEGVILGLYKFEKWKSGDAETSDYFLDLVIVTDGDQSKENAIQRGVRVSKGVMLARDLVNSPANRMTPTNMAETAQGIAVQNILDVSVLEESDMEQLGMESLLGVSKGSVEPAKLIVLEYKGDPDNPENNIAFVGKGITFDTGGISLKPPGGMENMKGDMAGGASVIGVMDIIAYLQPKVNVLGIVAASENMPGGNAQKPGDVVKAMNGKTIEVINTDAEGRLVLADALSYAESKGIVNVIDIATLTGAMVVTLGKVCTGYMTNSSEFGSALCEAARVAGEKFWELPLFDEYDDLIRSDVADMKNTGGRQAGSITAAKLLEKFVGDMNWIHLDIAGTSTASKNDGSNVKGATGHPVLSLVQLVVNMSND